MKDYLMHYRTKGSKNGYTKYPGKYTPIGEKAEYSVYLPPLRNIYAKHNNISNQNIAKKQEYIIPKGPNSGYEAQQMQKKQNSVNGSHKAKSVVDTFRLKKNPSSGGHTMSLFDIRDAILSDAKRKHKGNPSKRMISDNRKDIVSPKKYTIKYELSRKNIEYEKDMKKDIMDFLIEDNIDRAKKLAEKGKEKVKKLLKKFF